MNVVKKYIWLLLLLNHTGGLTLPEIERKWEESHISDGAKLNRHTFLRWKNTSLYDSLSFRKRR